MPDLASSAGVWIDPPATITVRARTVSLLARGPAKRPVTPVGVIRVTRQPAYRRAPRVSARGTLVTSIDCFAPVGQPLLQLLLPAQCSWLRRLGTIRQPFASAPALSSSESRPIVSGSCSPTDSSDSASSKYG